MTTHVGFGLFTGSLPSGRLKGKALARDAAPTMGGEEGMTATIKSISKIDWTKFSNGIACTFTIHPDIARIDNGKLFEGIMRTLVKLGVMHAQFNSLSPELLKKAQENPEKYQDLLVRVSGYSARFVDLPREVQDEIIGRLCYCS
jgi:formate C-acetyltransferase